MTSTASSSLPTPITVSTSQAWDNDGAGEWSTFIVNVGTPPQSARVLISTAGYSTWVIHPRGCPSDSNDPDYLGPEDCENARGDIVNFDNSTSFVNLGTWSLELEASLGLGGNGAFGRDTVSLGYTGSGGPTLQKQNVAGVPGNDYWLGLFGVDPVPQNFTDLNDPQPSYLHNLREEELIPSTSWAYTAGATYRFDRVQGSLTLGGYDSSRFGDKNVSFPFYDDIQRRYTVGLNSIVFEPKGLATSTSSTTLMSQRISMLIDSTTPYIWLPKEACDRFAAAFGLIYNTASEIYTLNNTAHKELQDLMPEFTFTISNTGGETLDIVLPYAAFDLMASYPVVTNATNYFPLKRAANSTQYTLGRSFLQEAYVIADHERAKFTVSPCVWPATFEANIKTIYPPGSEPEGNTTTNGNLTVIATAPPASPPIGAIVGGVIGGLALMMAAFVFWFFYWRKRHQNRPNASELHSAASSSYQQNFGLEHAYKHGDPSNPELDGLYSSRDRLDIYAAEHKKNQELFGTPVLAPKHELRANEPVGLELDSPEIYEMAAREQVATELSGRVSPRSDTNLNKEPGYFDRTRSP